MYKYICVNQTIQLYSVIIYKSYLQWWFYFTTTKSWWGDSLWSNASDGAIIYPFPKPNARTTYLRNIPFVTISEGNPPKWCVSSVTYISWLSWKSIHVWCVIEVAIYIKAKQTCIEHNFDVIMTTMASQITSLTKLFTQPFIRAQIKVNIKAPRHWPL